ncbi:MAG: agmatinase [Thermoanaerobaculia bacterium]|nr:agmatinase [Thermoanaerobaculia bacterium]
MAYQPTSQPHTGIATFCKSPFETDLENLEADVAVVGIPYDGATAMRPGSRQAPRAIRDASGRFGFLGRGHASRGFFDINRDRQLLEGVRIVDTGDVDTVYYKREQNFERIEQHLKGILACGALPVVLGGDHSISYPVLRAFEELGPLTIVLVDAHLDYKLDVMGLPFTNNSPFRRAHELDHVGRILNFGIRGIKSTDQDLRESRANGHLTFSNYDVFERGIEALLEECGDVGNYYLSIDIDGLDPSIAPGTESPEAEGLTFTQVKKLALGLADRGRLVGVDLVEVNPYLDPAELTQHMAVQLLIEVIATRFRS